MQFVKLQKQEPFVSLFYTLTWPIGQEHMPSFAEALISSDLIKKPDNIRLSVTGMAGPRTSPKGEEQ